MPPLKEKILDCKQKNPDWGWKRIAKALNIKRGIVRYHLTPGAKDKTRERMRKNRPFQHPMRRKIDAFLRVPGRSRVATQGIDRKQEFSVDNVIAYLGKNPKCYLTGTPIDLLSPEQYSLDHKIPKTKGGTMTLSNLGLTTMKANMRKNDDTPEEFFAFCKQVLEHNGYYVEKKG